MKTAIAAFILSMLCGTILTPLVRRLAHRFGALDHARSSRKIHGKPIPRLGGIAIVIAFYAPLAGLLIFQTEVGHLFLAERHHVLGLFIGGGQLYYPLGMVVVMFAAGTIPTVEFLSRSWQRRTGAAGVVAFFGVVSALLVLPLLPAGFVARTPIPAINEATRDQVGWPDYVAGVAGVYRAIPPREAAHTVIVTTNYGEAGAIVGGIALLP